MWCRRDGADASVRLWACGQRCVAERLGRARPVGTGCRRWRRRERGCDGAIRNAATGTPRKSLTGHTDRVRGSRNAPFRPGSRHGRVHLGYGNQPSEQRREDQRPQDSADGASQQVHLQNAGVSPYGAWPAGRGGGGAQANRCDRTQDSSRAVPDRQATQRSRSVRNGTR